jgi:hypothetical protein
MSGLRNRVYYRHLRLSAFQPGKRLRGFTAAYLCKALEIGDRRAVSRTWDRAGARHE